MNAAESGVRQLVLVGGGHAHVAVLKRLGLEPVPGLQCTLVTPQDLTPYSGMLPGLLAGHYTHAQAHLDLVALARFAGARLARTSATGIDPEARVVECADHDSIPFDVLSLDVGSTPTASHIDGASEHAMAVKPVDVFLRQLSEVEARLLERAGRLTLVVIGAGAGGVELALSVHHRLGSIAREAGFPEKGFEMHVIGGADSLPGHGDGVRRRLRDALGRRGIRLHEGRRAVAVTADRVTLEDGESIDCHAAILVTHASAAPWLRNTGLALDERGFVRVGTTLESVSHRGVFAAGDVAAVEGHRLTKSGVFAVRQGPVLAENLVRAAAGEALVPYQPQSQTLALISTGDPNAVASWGGFSVEGRWVWHLKDWIDRRWMRAYQKL